MALMNIDQIKVALAKLKETEIKTFNNLSAKGGVGYRNVGAGWGGNMNLLTESTDDLTDADAYQLAKDTDFDAGFDVAFLIRPAKLPCK